MLVMAPSDSIPITFNIFTAEIKIKTVRTKSASLR